MRSTNPTRGIAYRAITAALSGIVAFGCASQPVAAFAEDAQSTSPSTTSSQQTDDLDLDADLLTGSDQATDSTSGSDPIAEPGADTTSPSTTQPAEPWKRLSGDTRYDTMAAIAREGWLNLPGADDDLYMGSDWAIVATGSNYPDALAASALAGASGDAPVILTASDRLSTQAKDTLEQLGVRRVYLMGGKSALSSTVERAINDMKITTTRIEGPNRIATSIEALKTVRSRVWENLTTIMVTTGSGYADALSAGPLAYRNRIPIVLANKDGKLSEEALDAIKGISSIRKVILVGGPAVVSNEVQEQLGMDYNVVRIAGQDRYETSAKLAAVMTEGDSGQGSASYGHTWEHPVVATGQDFPDALAGAALAGRLNGVLLLADSSRNETVDLLKKQAKDVYTAGESYLLGGESAISTDLADILSAIHTN